MQTGCSVQLFRGLTRQRHLPVDQASFNLPFSNWLRVEVISPGHTTEAVGMQPPS